VRQTMPGQRVMTHGMGHVAKNREVRSGDSDPPNARPRPEKRAIWIMSREECAIIKQLPNIHCASGLRNRAMMEMMHRTGLRVSEVCGLLSRDIIGIEEGDTVAAAARVLGKGSKWRTISLDIAAVHWMRRWNDTRRGRRISGTTFFPTLKGGRLSTRFIQDLVKRLRERAAEMELIPWERAKKITPHGFRHAFATEACEELETTDDLRKLQAQLGHALLATTSIYMHIRDGALSGFLSDRKPDLPLE